ncbi:hypothetical protein BDN70DRAFT_925582 [Pholiota conissans]|uniref:Uncharacterized protein n=1 Tax=Pholiota conissans TaxID=109636 RepID=A0A9P5YPE5_9AGAR|nr:hypothetical protein BDN70DRAFT_925582 [Pholiota conissans]
MLKLSLMGCEGISAWRLGRQIFAKGEYCDTLRIFVVRVVKVWGYIKRVKETAKISRYPNANIARSVQIPGRPHSREAKSRFHLRSANDDVPQGAPKKPTSKLLEGPGRTLSSHRPRMPIPCHDPPHLRTPLDENLLSNTNAPSGSAETNDGEGKLRQSQMQYAELDRAKKRAHDPEQERDHALIHARDAQEKAQMRILELEDTLKSVEAELNSKSQSLDSLITTSDGLRLQIDALEADLEKSASFSKDVEDERDRAVDHAREANNAQSAAEARIQALEDELTSQIDSLTTDFLDSTINSKSLEAERDRVQFHVRELDDAQMTTKARVQELENSLISTKDELSSKVEALVVLTANSGTLQSKINALTIDLRNSAAASTNLEE